MMTHYKTKVALAAALLSIFGLTARAQDYCAVVEMQGGERVEYLLADNPRIAQQGAVVTLSTDKTTVEYAADDIAKVYLAEATADPSAIVAADSRAQWRMEGGELRLTGFAPGQEVSAFAANGTLAFSHSVAADGTLRLPLTGLSKGIYIIKTAKLTIKINNK